MLKEMLKLREEYRNQRRKNYIYIISNSVFWGILVGAICASLGGIMEGLVR